MKTIYDKSQPEKGNDHLPDSNLWGQDPEQQIPDHLYRSNKPRLPEISNSELIRHYIKLSKLNYGVDDGLYPLGSCTMKYNPKINEDVADNQFFTRSHPLQADELNQGTLELMYNLGELLKGIGGFPAITLQPAAGAHGELTGMLLIRKYHKDRSQLQQRSEILLPDSAHGTNPASASIAGFDVVEVPSNNRGTVDLEELNQLAGAQTAGIMLTVPNTLGIFERDIQEITRIIHDTGGLCYMDGANLNAFLGRVRPGDMNMDILHYNLHKTFSTPHGGGGPGSGPVAVTDRLQPYLPRPQVCKEDEKYILDWDQPKSIGKVGAFYGHFGVLIKAYAYILTLGDAGLKRVSGDAVLNANYLKEQLQEFYELPYDEICKHEFVLSGEETGDEIKTVDIAKRLLDYGFHPPTVYFPLIVKEAMMIEPTETESKRSLDEFVEALKKVAFEAEESPQTLHEAPKTTPVGRLDETQAARNPVLRWQSTQDARGRD